MRPPPVTSISQRSSDQTVAELAKQLRDKPTWHPVDSQRDLANRATYPAPSSTRPSAYWADHSIIAKHEGMYYVS
jgi:hypothetical protein